MAKIFNLIIFILFILTHSSFAQEPKIYVIFRNDDPSAISDAEHEKKVMEIFEKHQIPQTFGIIPNVVEDFHDANCRKFHLLTENQAMLDLLKKWQREGLIEIAQHGYTHQTNALHPTKKTEQNNKIYQGPSGVPWLPYAPANSEGYSEFRGLSYDEQFRRISQGKQLLENWFGTPVTTFILPWNSHDKNTIRAANEAGMRIISSSLNSFNNPSSISLYDNLLFIQHTINLDEFKHTLVSAQQFIKQTNKPVLITVLYHSWQLKSPKDFQLLEEIAKEISQSDDITVMTLGEIATKFPRIVRNIFLIKLKAQSETQKVDRLFSLIRRQSSVTLSTGFDILDVNYYITKEKQAISLYRKFYLAVAGMGILIAILYLNLVKLKLIKRVLALIFTVMATSLFVLLLIIGYFGLFGFDSGIGVIDSITLLFLGIVAMGSIIGYFNISPAKL